jgi:hypothetical protein
MTFVPEVLPVERSNSRSVVEDTSARSTMSSPATPT